MTFDCVKKSLEEAEIVQKKGDNEELSFDVEELDGSLDISCFNQDSFYREDDFDTDLWNKNLNPGAGGRLIDWEERVNTALKIRPGHFHDVDEKCVNSTRKYSIHLFVEQNFAGQQIGDGIILDHRLFTPQWNVEHQLMFQKQTT